MQYRGLFVGLTTLDFVYKSDRPLAANQKIVAQDYLTVAGGPATNAAVVFNYFGNHSKLLSVVGRHPLTKLINHDLGRYSIEAIDLMPDKTDSPPVSSIIVDSTTGKRAIISINAVKSQADPQTILDNLLTDLDIVLLDGHQLEVSLKVAEIARSKSIPVVLDGGSWKPGLEQLLPKVDYAVCSANFYPPQHNQTESNCVLDYLTDCGIKYIAITQGEQPILYQDHQTKASIAIPPLKAVDTLGAGDIFHGAFCHYILQADFPHALQLAAKTASKSCLSFGTRSWLKS